MLTENGTKNNFYFTAVTYCLCFEKKNSFSSTVHPLAVNAIANVKEEALLLKLKRLQSPADLALALPCVSTRQ